MWVDGRPLRRSREPRSDIVNSKTGQGNRQDLEVGLWTFNRVMSESISRPTADQYLKYPRHVCLWSGRPGIRKHLLLHLDY